MSRRIAFPALILVGLAALALSLLDGGRPAQSAPLTYDNTFWQQWSDGQAELAGYALTYPRYRAARSGSAVTIFVKEDFANPTRVKADAGQHPADEVFPVMKLNLMQDFPTGVYDYNLMTSAFLTLQPVNGRAAGTLTKVAFGSQEWCGHVYHQLLFDSVGIREISHSYFDGEADQANTLEYPADGIAEDALLFWARGMAEPTLDAGQSVDRPLLMSPERARLTHTPLMWQTATFIRSADSENVTVPAGTFATDRYTVRTEDKRTTSIYVERDAPHRIIKWETSEGFAAELLGSKRMAYWQMNGPGYEKALADIGLTARQPRMP